MRKILLSILILSAYSVVSLGQGSITEGKWTYIVEGGGATIISSRATGEVTVPSELGGLPVRRVGRQGNIDNNSVQSLKKDNYEVSDPYAGGQSFSLWGQSGNRNVISIVIPNGVNEIGQRAFANCTGLTKVTIPESVKYIGFCAFYYCPKLSKLTLSDGLVSIETGAFISCHALSTIAIPNSVTFIGSYAFRACRSITDISIPDKVTRIDEGVFMNCRNLSSITIPDGVRSIEDLAFKDCPNLSIINIPENMTNIASNAFAGCRKLPKETLEKIRAKQ
jgi:hypothetical protein